MNVELALPVANWKKSQEVIAQDLASVILEFQRKPNIYWTTLEELVRLTDTNRTNHPVYQNENTATTETVSWAAFSDAECLAWISSRVDGFYKWSRVVVSRKYEENGIVRVQSVAVCLPLSPTQCVRVYEAFADAPNSLDDEEFNDRPVEFNLPEGKTFNDLVLTLTKKTIAQLTAEKMAALKDGREIAGNNHTAIISASTLYEQVFVGAKIEQEIIARGHLINQLRDCPGILNSEMLNLMTSDTFPGVATLQNIDKFKTRRACASCGFEKYVWGAEDGGCNVCLKCNLEYDLGLR
ncbi:MAG: hypothetical protein G01um10145_792 [Microgenomates group bacterium Gr01-1014_5]|nr:MAG: hypothetical protein G01um10145_792 [Microgenomates group bacterium Gr01-1014_5]